MAPSSKLELRPFGKSPSCVARLAHGNRDGMEAQGKTSLRRGERWTISHHGFQAHPFFCYVRVSAHFTAKFLPISNFVTHTRSIKDFQVKLRKILPSNLCAL